MSGVVPNEPEGQTFEGSKSPLFPFLFTAFTGLIAYLCYAGAQAVGADGAKIAFVENWLGSDIAPSFYWVAWIILIFLVVAFGFQALVGAITLVVALARRTK